MIYSRSIQSPEKLVKDSKYDHNYMEDLVFHLEKNSLAQEELVFKDSRRKVFQLAFYKQKHR